MSKTWNYLKGYVIIKIEGPNLEKLINLAISRGIDLWDIKRAENLIIAKTRVDSLSSLKPLVRKTKCSVRILRKFGLPFICFRLGRRKGLVIAGVSFLAILYFLSSFIWFVQIEGNKKIPSHQILQIAAEEGLTSGKWKKKLDTKRVETALVSKIPELAWAGINIHGTKANIQVEERTMVKIDKRRMDCLVATADGLITQFLAISGQPLVQEGDTVKKGQMLISGIKGSDDNQGIIPARGRVKARVWYDLYREAYLKQERRNRTGQVAKALWLKIGDKFYLLRGVAHSPYPRFEQEVIRQEIPKKYNLPFGWLRVNYHEVKISYHSYTLEQIKKRLRDQALCHLLTKLKPGTQIISESVAFLEGPAEESIPGLVRVKVRIETLEDIGKIEQFILKEPERGVRKNSGQ